MLLSRSGCRGRRSHAQRLWAETAFSERAISIPARPVWTTALPPLLTPHLDLTESGDTFHTNMGVDTVLPKSLTWPATLGFLSDRD